MPFRCRGVVGRAGRAVLLLTFQLDMGGGGYKQRERHLLKGQNMSDAAGI